MIEYADKELFLMDSIEKQLNIAYEGGEITNSELVKEGFSLVEKLTSNGTITLGECNSSYVEFTVGYGTESLEGKNLTIKITPKDARDFQIGKYKVLSDKPTADRRWRNITAYDALSPVLNMDVTDWFDTILPVPDEGEEPAVITIKQFRDSFMEYVGLIQEQVELPNDGVEISRMLDPTKLSGKVVLNKICELNGCFGRIDRNGVFRYVFLQAPSDPLYPSETLYPSEDLFPKFEGNPTEIGIGLRYKYPLPKRHYPSEDLFPSEDLYPVDYEIEELRGVYMSAKYEDYIVTQIGAIQIRDDKNDVGVTVGSGLIYVIEGNFLTYGLDEEVRTQIAANILDKVGGVYYCPSEIKTKGNPCLEIGDPIFLQTRYSKIETIIFQRKLTGIQALIDTYVSKGTKDNKQNINSVQSQLTNTEGKINKVSADLVEAKKVIAEEIQADRARISQIEADYITTSQLNAVDAKIDNLSTIAITTQDMSAIRISGSQITAGTITADRLSATSLASSDLTVNSMTLNGILHCKFGSSTNFGLTYVDVNDPSDLIGTRVAVFYAE